MEFNFILSEVKLEKYIHDTVQLVIEQYDNRIKLDKLILYSKMVLPKFNNL